MLLFLITSKVSAQEVKITPELSKKIIEEHGINNFDVFPVKYKEIEYRKLLDGEVMTSYYKRVLDELEKYKPGYDYYVQQQNDLKNCITNIDKFLESNDKYDVKEQYLKEAQSIADKYKITVIAKDDRLISKLRARSSYGHDRELKDVQVYAFRDGKRTSKNDAKSFKDGLIEVMGLQSTNEYANYSTYIDLTEHLKKAPKTQPGKVLSDSISKRFAYIVEDKSIGIENLSGTFTILPGNFRLQKEDFQDKRIKNELVQEGDYKSYPIIQRIGTAEYYYITTKDFLPYVSSAQFLTKVVELVNKAGYKEYYHSDGKAFIKTKTAEIELDGWIYKLLKENPNYITEFDNDQLNIAALVKQTIPHSKTLDKYIGMYRIQWNRISSANLAAWRTATANAQKLHDRIYKITEKYEGNYSYSLFNKSNVYQEFLDNLLASKGVLGM